MQTSFFGWLPKVVGFVAVVGLASAFYFFLSSDPNSRTPQLPEPNGYNVFLDAAQLLNGDPPAELNSTNTQVRMYVEQNREALEKVREGLLLESRVVINFRTNVAAYSQAHMPELASMKRFGRALIAEGLVASSENRFNDAITSFLDCIRFGQKCSYGGPMMDRLVGFSIERIGINHTRAILENLSAQECRNVIRSIETVNEQAESISDTLANEKLYVRAFFGWRGRIAALVMSRSLKAGEQNFIAKAREHDRVGKQFLLETAIRAFSLEKGRNPDQLTELFQDHLKERPQDSLTQTGFGYDKMTGTVTVRTLPAPQVD